MKKNSALVPILLGFSLLSWSPVHAHLKDAVADRSFTINQDVIRGKVTSETGNAVVGAQ